MPARSPRCGPTTCSPRSSPRSSPRAAFAPEKIEDVVVGCGNQGGEDSRCVARHAALVAGLPIEVPGSVLQRNCGSGLNAIAVAAQQITCGEGDVFVAGGVESMSRAPFVMGKAESPYSRDMRIFDSTIGARFPNPKVEGRYGGDTMPETADNLARDYQITREAGRYLRRRLAVANTPPPRPTASSTARSSRSRCRAAAPARSRSARTSIRGRRPTWRRSPSCGRCSRTASPPPATPRASTTARWR